MKTYIKAYLLKWLVSTTNAPITVQDTKKSGKLKPFLVPSVVPEKTETGKLNNFEDVLLSGSNILQKHDSTPATPAKYAKSPVRHHDREVIEQFSKRRKNIEHYAKELQAAGIKVDMQIAMSVIVN